MEQRKQVEIEHYDKLAKEWQERFDGDKEMLAKGDIEMIDVMKMKSYQFVYDLLKKEILGKQILDYGCGHGMHAVKLIEMGAKEVVGIDLSEESLKIARKRADIERLRDVVFIKMDAEKLEFPDNSFDIVFDGGTFSSIDINKAFSEISRVLRPGGKLIGIETLGHNPFANVKRWLNKKRGIRTGWAADHIMKMKDYKIADKYFHNQEKYFFHFFSLFAMPFQRFPGGTILVNIFETIDSLLLKIPFLKRYGFKTVFVLEK